MASEAGNNTLKVKIRLPKKLRPKTPYEGWVKKLPKLADKEKRWLGQTLHPELADIWFKCHGSYLTTLPQRTRLVEVVSSDEDSMGTHDEELASNMLEYLKRHRQRGELPAESVEGSPDWVRQMIYALPPDIEVDPNIEPFLVATDDPRKGLRKQLGARVKVDVGNSGQPVIRAGHIIAPYRGYMSYGHDYIKSLSTPPDGYPYPISEWVLKCDSYSVDLCDAEPILPIPAVMQPPPKGAKGGRKAPSKKQPLTSLLLAEASARQRSEEDGSAAKKWVVSSAYMYGNLMALINDSLVDPHSRTPPREIVGDANVGVRHFRIGPFAYPFVVAERDLCPGDELLWSYGDGYWELNARGLLFCKVVAEKDAEVKQQAARIAALKAELQAMKGEGQATEAPSVQQTATQTHAADLGRQDLERASLASEAAPPERQSASGQAQHDSEHPGARLPAIPSEHLGPRLPSMPAASDPGRGQPLQLNLNLSDSEVSAGQHSSDTHEATPPSPAGASPLGRSQGRRGGHRAGLGSAAAKAAIGSGAAADTAVCGEQEAVAPQQHKGSASLASPAAEKQPCGLSTDWVEPALAVRTEQPFSAGRPRTKAVAKKSAHYSGDNSRKKARISIAEDSAGEHRKSAQVSQHRISSTRGGVLQPEDNATASGSGASSREKSWDVPADNSNEGALVREEPSSSIHGKLSEVCCPAKRKQGPLGAESTPKLLTSWQSAAPDRGAVVSPSSFSIVLDSGDDDDNVAADLGQVFEIIDLT